jgi:hypothetical protein
VLRNRFFKWCSSSLIGHLILFQLICAAPLSVMFILNISSEHTLTFGRAFYIAGLCSVLFAIVAVLFWYTLSKPLISSRSKK